MPGQREEADRIRWVCAQTEGAAVLHVGSGTGAAAIILAREGKSVVGTEPEARSLADARRRLVEEDEEVQERVSFIACNPSKLPFKPNAFDTVTLGDVLESPLDLEATVGEAMRVLRPQGRLVVVGPWTGTASEPGAAGASLASVLKALSPRVAIDLLEGADDWIGLAGRRRARASRTAGRLIPVEALRVVERRLERSRRDEREVAAMLADARSEAQRLAGAKEAVDDKAFGLVHEVRALRGRERDLQEIVAGRREQTARLEAQRESLLARLRELEAHDQQIAHLRRQLEDGESARQEAIANRERASAEAEKLWSDLKGNEEALRRAEAELTRERSARTALARRIESLQASSSYKLMRALWRINAAIRRPFAGLRRGLSRGGHAEPEPERAEVRSAGEAQAADQASPTETAPEAPAPAIRVEADAERQRWLAKVGPPRSPGELRVAAVLDEMSRACFAPECDLITFGSDDWRESLEEREPHLLLVESTWQGNSGSWQYQIATYSHPDYAGLPNLKALLEWCRGREIPTVFWNKEDPVHFDRFTEAAALFDHVLTTDSNCIRRYEALEDKRAKTIEALPFAAQPLIHNPIALATDRSDSPCFAGAYYKDRHPDRRRSLEMLLDAARPYDLVIYDRTHGSEDKTFGFPERFDPHIRGSLSYDEMLTAYKGHKVFLNVNSVADSPTMFSRRVFELAACDTAVLSTESVGVANIFGDLIPMVETPEQATEALERLLGDEEHRRRHVVPARRLVLGEHTYRNRLATIAATAGYEVSADVGEEFAVLVLVDDVEQARGVRPLVTSISEQTTIPAEFLIGVGARTSVAGDLQQLSDASDELRVRVMQQDAGTSRMERFRELAAIAASPWVAIVHTAHAYGKHHFTDLLACTRFTRADVIGSAAFAVSSGEMVDADLEHRYADFLHPHSVLARREVVTKRGWPDEMPSAWASLEAWRQEGVRFYSGDRENFRADPALGLPPRRADLPVAAARANR
jgi:SAM-dependent methyltransferase